MQRFCKIASIVLVVITVIAVLMYQLNLSNVTLSIVITFATISYHFLMRMAVGNVINGIFHNKFNYNRKWFQEKKFEKYLYKRLRVKKWKDKMPTFAPVTISTII